MFGGGQQVRKIMHFHHIIFLVNKRDIPLLTLSLISFIAQNNSFPFGQGNQAQGALVKAEINNKEASVKVVANSKVD